MRASLNASFHMSKLGSAGPETEKRVQHPRARSEQWRETEASVPPRARQPETLKAAREALPIWQYRTLILEAVRANQIVIIQGETGCGKTTQVGQMILEEATETHQACSVVCTQPRRISAIGVSERVAVERGEVVGGTVGFSIRHKHVAGQGTHLLFCTTGILLRRLANDADLNATTHVIVDEVHERSVESDFLLLALRDLARRRPQLKIILMSATMNHDLFGRYFGGAPNIVVPGRTFPVEVFFLEDALNFTKHVPYQWHHWGKGKGRGRQASLGDDTENEAYNDNQREDLSDDVVQSRYRAYDSRVQGGLQSIDQDAINYDLIVSLLGGRTLEKLAMSRASVALADVRARPNGVLVFLPGAAEIEFLRLGLLETFDFKEEPARSWVLPLHGGLDPDEQKKVFDQPPPSIRKIVLSTNVAETSITIDDIGYVIDTCRMKEMRFDAVRRASALEDTVISRTNAQQRRGRAGRVAPGIAVHVGLTRYRHDHKILEYQTPEIRRLSLERLVLQIHDSGLNLRDKRGASSSVCARLLEPPHPLSVARAVDELVRIGAINFDFGRECLTPLGKQLANLPLEPRLGKLVLFGAAFGPSAADAILTVAAALTARSLFVAPLESREEGDEAKKNLSRNAGGGPVGLSDHMAMLAAYRGWDQLPYSGSNRSEFCQRNFLSMTTLQDMSEMKQGLLETLSENGFAPPKIRATSVAGLGRRHGSDGVLLALTRGTATKPCSPALVAALLCAAFFPQVTTATTATEEGDVARREEQGGSDVQRPRFMIKDAASGRPVEVRIFPSTVLKHEDTLSSPYYVYHELLHAVHGEFFYVRDVTAVPPLALALFGGILAVEANKQVAPLQVLTVDGWFRFAVPAKFGKQLLLLRKYLDDMLASWLVEPGQHVDWSSVMPVQGVAEPFMAIAELISIQEQVAPPELTAEPTLPPPMIEARQQRMKKKGYNRVPGANRPKRKERRNRKDLALSTLGLGRRRPDDERGDDDDSDEDDDDGEMPTRNQYV